jgi:hypothetical protein
MRSVLLPGVLKKVFVRPGQPIPMQRHETWFAERHAQRHAQLAECDKLRKRSTVASVATDEALLKLVMASVIGREAQHAPEPLRDTYGDLVCDCVVVGVLRCSCCLLGRSSLEFVITALVPHLTRVSSVRASCVYPCVCRVCRVYMCMFCPVPGNFV